MTKGIFVKLSAAVLTEVEFAGMLSDAEADELEKIIEEGCEQIHPDDWK